MELQAKIESLEEHLQKLEAQEQVRPFIPCNTALLGASSSHVCTAAGVCPSQWLPVLRGAESQGKWCCCQPHMGWLAVQVMPRRPSLG